MATWQAYLTSFVLRHVLKPRLIRALEVEQARAAFRGRDMPLPAGCVVTPARVGGVPGEWLSCDTREAGTLLYLHGGGYIACNPWTYRPITTAFAIAGLRTFVPDYRLAPEHPFPAAIKDALATYRALIAETDPRHIVLAGDSAGGGLSLALLLSLREQGLALPAAVVLFSPLTDLSVSGASVSENGQRCAMFNREVLLRAARLYLGDLDPCLPLASPLHAELQGLPPILIHVGRDETLLDDSVRLGERLRAAGNTVQLQIWPVVPHVWQLFRRFVPEGGQSLSAAANFLRHHLPSRVGMPVLADTDEDLRSDTRAAAPLS
jgi:epsilon-lactone hydrolase